MKCLLHNTNGNHKTKNQKSDTSDKKVNGGNNHRIQPTKITERNTKENKQ